MDFRDKDGGPLVRWTGAESAFRAWQACSAGRPCDYTGMSYAKLRAGGETQWPATSASPAGASGCTPSRTSTPTPTTAGPTGTTSSPAPRSSPASTARSTRTGARSSRPPRTCRPAEPPSDEFPLRLNTGRTLYHFHTRTKTGRAPQLHDAAPDVWVELSAADADAHGIGEGDVVAVVAPRGRVTGRARITGVRPGVVFVPFHHGYWDRDGDGEHERAANELTITQWDAVSKQPIFKTAACRIEQLTDAGGEVAPAPTTTASRPLADVPATTGGAAAQATEELPS